MVSPTEKNSSSTAYIMTQLNVQIDLSTVFLAILLNGEYSAAIGGA